MTEGRYIGLSGTPFVNPSRKGAWGLKTWPISVVLSYGDYFTKKILYFIEFLRRGFFHIALS